MPHDPKDIPCEWCGDPSRHAIERMRKVRGVRSGYAPSGMFMYVCDAHEHLAEANKYPGVRR